MSEDGWRIGPRELAEIEREVREYSTAPPETVARLVANLRQALSDVAGAASAIRTLEHEAEINEATMEQLSRDRDEALVNHSRLGERATELEAGLREACELSEHALKQQLPRATLGNAEIIRMELERVDQLREQANGADREPSDADLVVLAAELMRLSHVGPGSIDVWWSKIARAAWKRGAR